ncbi:hypothetical protein HF325_005218 [Metschnikowia pulcherrima]|uniref:Sorting nexin-4 n=1 Tax=Metschnikowia pulcherrima TaxID=27326 RepID=A0A8H7GPU2_9ASCO|nr:hypothetical protein HF325_005218 [Metschnikowia pulcherrima]
MNLDEPFTSVNWDRDEPASKAIDTSENAALTLLGSLEVQHTAISEEENSRQGSPTIGAADSPDLSSLQLGNRSVSAQNDHVSEHTAEDCKEARDHEYATQESASEMPESAKNSGRISTSEKIPNHGAYDHPSEHQKEARNSPKLTGLGANYGDLPPNANLTHTSSHAASYGAGPDENATIENDQTSYNPSLRAQHVASQEISDQKQMEDAFARYTISLRVSNPISDRDGNSKPFISYLVTSDTNHPEILRLLANNSSEKTTVKVRRRYGDFRFLHDCLVSDFPQLLVPPLPAKLNFKYLTGDTFSTAFVHKRLNSLDRFVTFICQHKLLSQLSVFHYFVSDSSEWATFTKNLKISKGDDDGLLVGKVMNEDILTETIMNFFTPSKHKKETNRDILEISDKLKKLYENLHDYELFLTQINKLAALHENSADTDANASLTSTNAGATSNFKIFSELLLFFLENWASLGRYIDELFLVSLKDCAKYIARLSSLIELHHNKKIDLQVLEDYLSKAKGDLANIGGSTTNETPHRAPPNPTLIGPNSGGIVNNTTQLIKDTLSTLATPHIGSSHAEGKKHRLQQKIAHLENEITEQTHLVNSLTSRIINEEYPHWDRFNKIQMKQAMLDLCDQEISFYKGLVDNWTDVEAKLVQRLEELKK